jgi:hypothetical protein
MPGLFCSVRKKGINTMSKSGPNTPAGKAAVSRNAVTHGIFSQAPVVVGVESQEEWEQHREGVIASLAPVGTLEETLAERAARLLWRQARVARFEMYWIDRWQQEIEDDLKFKYQLEVGTTSPEARTNCSPQQIRAVHLQRQQFLLLLRRFPELADDAFLTYEEASRIGEAVLDAAGDPGELSLDGEPGEQPEDLPRVRVGTLREGLRQVAKRAGIHIAELWARTAQQAIADAAWQQERAERLEGYFPVWHAYRVVPREQELEKVMRYEAHLSRELARLLKDFHALQKARRAAPAETPEPYNCKTNAPALPSAPSAPPSALTAQRAPEPSAPSPSPAPVEVPQPHNCKTNPLPPAGEDASESGRGEASSAVETQKTHDCKTNPAPAPACSQEALPVIPINGVQAAADGAQTPNCETDSPVPALSPQPSALSPQNSAAAPPPSEEPLPWFLRPEARRAAAARKS